MQVKEFIAAGEFGSIKRVSADQHMTGIKSNDGYILMVELKNGFKTVVMTQRGKEKVFKTLEALRALVMQASVEIISVRFYDNSYYKRMMDHHKLMDAGEVEQKERDHAIALQINKITDRDF